MADSPTVQTAATDFDLTWTDHGKGYWELRQTAPDRRVGAVHYAGWWSYPPTYSWEAEYRWSGNPAVRGEGLPSPEVAMVTCEAHVRGWLAAGEPEREVGEV